MKKIDIYDYLDENEVKEPNSWDYNLDYKETYKMLVRDIETLRIQFSQGNITINRVKAFTNLIIGLTQLRNGARVGETVAAINLFCSDMNKRRVQVPVQKRKDIYHRKIVLPDEIKKSDLEIIKNYINERDDNKKNFIIALCKFFQKHYNFSTHALRYSWIGFMCLIKTPAQVIAKITGHKTLELVLHYTQRKIADKVLYSMVWD